MVPLASCEDAVHGLNGVSISGSTECCVKLKDDAEIAIKISGGKRVLLNASETACDHCCKSHDLTTVFLFSFPLVPVMVAWSCLR